MKDSCEKIQHFGAMKDETGSKEETDEDLCLERCRTTVGQAKQQFQVAEVKLKRFYRDE